MDKLKNSTFIRNLKRQAEENPLLAIAVGVTLIGAATKAIDAAANNHSKRAYAKQVNARLKNRS